MTLAAVAPLKFHVSLNVAELDQSVDFYRAIFGAEPARRTSDYAKFEIEEPPLVLSLIPGQQNICGALNHLGIRLRDFESMIQMQARLETAGIRTNREDGVQCCHSQQTKFWVTDPNRVLWEFYILHDEHDEIPHTSQDIAPETGRPLAEQVSWRHQIPEPFPSRIPHVDNSVHRVVLEGTANLKPAAINLADALAEAYRVLRPGGEVSLHGLAGDRKFMGGHPVLPGPASVVEYVPIETEALRAMTGAGFFQVRYEKLSREPFFVIDGVQMREILLVGKKPGHRPKQLSHQVIYLGPLAQVTDDFGNLFPRGARVSLNIHDFQALSQRTTASQFLFLPADAPLRRQP
jgi:catechol 2,3-dioxygenase-like lactoylglutathione lyase family enzyme